MRKPVTFVCRSELQTSRLKIFDNILDEEQWTTFSGYGPLPGIRKATFLNRTEEVSGSRVRVENEDGTSHIESIAEWVPEERIVIELGEFPSPLNRLAEKFIETWTFPSGDGKEWVVRRFDMYPTGIVGRCFLPGIAFLMKKAVERHMEVINRDQ